MDLVISETPSSTWHYHLRKVGPEGRKYGGAVGKALCGAELGWDTTIPLAAYGKRDHITSRWCQECQGIAWPSQQK